MEHNIDILIQYTVLLHKRTIDLQITNYVHADYNITIKMEICVKEIEFHITSLEE